VAGRAFYYFLSVIWENYSFVGNLFDKKVSIDFCSFFEIEYGYFGVRAIKFVMRKYVGDSISAVDKVIYNEYFELRKIFDNLGHVLDFSPSMLTIDIDHFDTFDTDEVGKKIGRKQSSPCNRDDDVWLESTMHDLICQGDALFL
jgi:hypothetical protein